MEIQGGINVFDDPSMSHEENERIFRASNIPGPVRNCVVPQGDLQEEQADELAELAQEVADLSLALGEIFGEWTLDRTLSALEEYSETNQLSVREALETAWDEIAELTEDENEPPPTIEDWTEEQHLRLTEKVRGQIRNMRNRFRMGGKLGDINLTPTTCDHTRSEARRTA